MISTSESSLTGFSTSLFPRGIPITKLPDELVLMIIQLGEQDSEGLSGDCAILASHVCSHWRSLLLAIPFLWSDVRVCNMPSGIPNFGRASAFVARSSPCPIRVTVFAAPLLHFGTASQGTQGVASDISAFIAPHVYRIQQFELYYTQHFRARDVEMMIPRGPAPLLDSLSVQCIINWTVAPLFGTNEPFVLPLLQSLHELDDAHEAAESFPNLKRLVLSSIAPTWSYFPLQNLRSLELQNLSTSTQPTWPQLCDVLKANAATLEVLTLDGGLPEGPSSCIPLIMPALTFLHLGYCSPGALEHFVAMVQVPRLTDLLLIDRSGTEEPSETSILASVIEHIPLYQLHTLHLSDIGFMTLEAPPVSAIHDKSLPHEFFCRLRALETLTLVRPDSWMLGALSQASPRLCSREITSYLALPVPRLSRLFLRDVDVEIVDDLIDILAIQWATHDEPAPPLRRLSELHVFLSKDEWDLIDWVEFLVTAERIADVVRCGVSDGD